jgi:nitroreductase
MKREILPGFEGTVELLKSRRSIRAYKESAVKRETLLTLIDAARYAPSGSNSQPVHWLLIEDKAEIKRLAALVVDWMRVVVKETPELAAPGRFDRIVRAWDDGIDRIFRSAPHLAVAFGLKTHPAAQPACIIALTYLELAACAMGLGTCWAGYFMRAIQSFPPLIRALDLPEDHQVFGAMMLGYAKHHYHRIPLRHGPAIIWR